MATYRPLLDVRCSRRLRRQLKDFARALSDLREADVRRVLLLELSSSGHPIEAADAARLRATLRRSRAESRRALSWVVATRDWMVLVENLVNERTLSALRLRPDAGLTDVLKLVDCPWRDAGALLARRSGSVAKLHRLRLALKRCRYALESVSGLQPDLARQALDRLRSAQDSLGELRDTVQARKWVRDNEANLGRSLVRLLDRDLKRRGTDLKAEALERAAKVLPAYARWRKGTRSLRGVAGIEPE
jgi:CHAD domain-containing protein